MSGIRFLEPFRAKDTWSWKPPEDNEGIKVIDNHAIDVAIVDLFMPSKEELETLITLRRSNPTLKVIASRVAV